MNIAGSAQFADDDTLVEDPEQNEEIILAPPSADEALRYFGVDFDVEGLVRRFDRHELIVPRFDPRVDESEDHGYEGFQRNFVWTKRQMDRFIESVLLGYPVPGIFLVELESRRYVVLDGQQRLTTLAAFYKGLTPDGKAFELDHVSEQFKGHMYDTLDGAAQRKLNNAMIQATITVPQGEDGPMAIYALFERINSGGTKLTPQQIRVALFAGGDATQLARKMNADPNWRTLFGTPAHRDGRDQELILRYLALKSVAESMLDPDSPDVVEFKPPMSAFMTKYLDQNKAIPASSKKAEAEEFSQACRLLIAAEGDAALRRVRTINAARADSILAALTLAIRRNGELSVGQVQRAMKLTNENTEYVLFTTVSTSHRKSVEGRLRIAMENFVQ
ncbi:DUF262 domain-containing protein [Nocardia fluminea]|uniref:DUF262 domain-containing protein n=1 Tax=Nocardia fluminea TaxID=134984 RepID=UPI0033F0CC40